MKRHDLPTQYFGDLGESENGELTHAWIEATRDLAAAEIVMRLLAQRNPPWRFLGNAYGSSAVPRRGVVRRRGVTHTQLAIVARRVDTAWSFELGWASWFALAGMWTRQHHEWRVLNTYDSHSVCDAARLWQDVNVAIAELSRGAGS